MASESIGSITSDRMEASLPPLITTEQTAMLSNLGVRTVWRWSRSGLMPAPVKIGGTERRPAAVRFLRDEILAWISAGCPRCDERGHR